MARSTGARRSTATPGPGAAVTSGAKTPPSETTRGGSPDRYVLPFIHVTVPGTLVHFGATRDQACRDRYVMPLAHMKVPANWIDYGIWAALGIAVAGEGVTLPIAGALGAGAVLRRRSRPPRQ